MAGLGPAIHDFLSRGSKDVDARDEPGHDKQLTVCVDAYRIGGAYWMPPALQSWFRPRGIFSLEPLPTLRS
jgi:hypothetical protein